MPEVAHSREQHRDPEAVGGFNHLAMIGRSGPMTHAESEAGIKLLSKELLPRLKEIKPVPVE